MSITITAIIKPSRFFFLLLILINIASFISLIWGVLLVTNSVNLILFIVLGMLWVGSVLYQKQFLRRMKIVQLNVASKGNVILRQLDTSNNFKHGVGVELVSTSVLWSFLMMLHLKTYQGNKIILPIFFDSVERDTFRRLSVAFRWLMIRTDVKIQ